MRILRVNAPSEYPEICLFEFLFLLIIGDLIYGDKCFPAIPCIESVGSKQSVDF